MDKQVQEVVNKEMERMGYTEFTLDTGMQMGMPGLDNAIRVLSKQEGIETGPHAYTASARLEKNSFVLNMPSSELFKVDEDYNNTYFEKVMNSVKTILDELVDNPQNLPQNAINVFTGDLYHVLHENPEEVKNDTDGILAMIDLFESQPKIFDSIAEWSVNAREGNNPVEQFVQIKNILDLSQDQEKIAKVNNGEMETFTLTRQVPDELQNLIGPLLEGKLTGIIEAICRVKSEVLNKNKDGNVEMQFNVRFESF